VNPDYQQLCTEIEYILKKRVKENNIEFSSLTSRAKTLNSFLEKIDRKHYKEPFQEITDFAGVRVVCLYSSDIERVSKLIREEFIIQEEINKKDILNADQFGYGAKHFIVKLGKSSSGARYDDLKEMVCEIQVRTIVQDAWAIIQHHMVYKKESEIPSKIQRKLNSLSALFETVDDQFENIRNERDLYIQNVIQSKNNKIEFLKNELNIDSFKEYLNWKFPNRSCEAWNGQSSMVIDALINAGFKNLIQIDELLDETKETRKILVEKLDKKIRKCEDGSIPSNIEPALAISSKSFEWRDLIPWGDDWIEVFDEVL